MREKLVQNNVFCCTCVDDLARSRVNGGWADAEGLVPGDGERHRGVPDVAWRRANRPSDIGMHAQIGMKRGGKNMLRDTPSPLLPFVGEGA